MQVLNLKVAGLYSYPNPLSEVPQGALSTADNIVINSKSVAKPRRGFSRVANAFSTGSDRSHKLTSYQDKLIANYATSKLAYYDSGWTNYSGTYQAPDTSSAKMKFMEAASNLFFTTSTGVYKIDAYNSTPALAGGLRGLDIKATLNAASGGFMSDTSQVGYRAVWGIKDLNGNLILGSPSQRAIVSNATGGTKDVDLVLTVPSGATTSHFFQVYRSPGSASASTEPTDELELVYEANPTSSQITAGSISFTDATPDSLRGAALYTNPSQQGILQQNDPPPKCKDMATFKGSAFYANTENKQRLFITLLAVGSGNLSAGDIITIDGQAYEAHASTEDATASPPTFVVSTGGSASQNIEDTANSLVRVINQTSASNVYALYVSGYNELPGKILLEDRDFGGASWAVVIDAHGSSFSPTLPTSGTTVSSDNETYKNALAISKTEQHEAVPATNILFCGSAADPIVRVLALRDSLFALKEKDGIYRITGTGPDNFQRELFDSTTRIVCPESAIVLNNQIWCLTDQGIVTISDTGIEVKSIGIEDKILRLLATAPTQVESYGFAVASETDRKYILFLPETSASTYASQAYVYNVLTDSWTRWTRDTTCGFSNQTDDKIYLGDASSAYTNVERKSMDYTDFCDEELAVTISAIDGTLITLSSVAECEVGDLLYQSASVKSVITSVDSTLNTVTVFNELPGWTAAAASLYKGYSCSVKWAPQTAENPGMAKHFSEATVFFDSNRFNSAELGFTSEISPGRESVDLAGQESALWGLFVWGERKWGGPNLARPFRVYVPLEKQRCSQINVDFTFREAQGEFELNGASLRFNQMTQTLTR